MLEQVKASAGSGKTYTLTKTFLELLRDASRTEETGACALGGSGAPGGFRWSEIMAVTFTNKAAAEMKERVIGSLKERVLQKDYSGPAESLSPREAERWLTLLLRRFGSLNIRTIDSLLNELVRVSALELNLPPDFTPVFGIDDLFTPLLDDCLTRAEAGDEEMLDLIRRACRSLPQFEAAKGFHPKDTLRKRLKEVLTWLLTDLPAEGGLVTDPDMLADRLLELHTAYVGAARDLNKAVESEGLKANARFLTALTKCKDTQPFVAPRISAYFSKDSLDDCLNKASKGTASPTAELAYMRLREAAERIEGEGGLLRRAAGLAAFVAFAATLYTEVDDLHRRQGVMLSALWPGMVKALLSGEFGVPEAFCRMGSRLHHLLVDEFQDTGRDQWDALEPLALECLAKDGRLFYVGDVKQAIYGWRGGDATLFDEIPDRPEISAVAGDFTQSPLPNNWRSLPEVVNFNNETFGLLEDPDFARTVAGVMMSENAPPDITDELAESIVAAYAGGRQTLPRHREPGEQGMVRLLRVDNSKDEDGEESPDSALSRLAETVRSIADRRPVGDIAVLVRTNRQASEVARVLLDEGLDVVTENSLLIGDHPVIRQTVSFLAFVDYPFNDLAFWEFVSGGELFLPVAGLDLTELSDWLARQEGGELFRHFQRDYPEVWERYIAPFYRQAGLMTPYDMISEIFQRFDAWERFPEERVFLRRFLETAWAAESQGRQSLSAFLDLWKESGGEEKLPLPENMDAVRIMTVHKSKGLEFEAVVVPFPDFPNHRADGLAAVDAAKVGLEFSEGEALVVTKDSPALGRGYYERLAQAMLEQLNLLYVALTRAAGELHLFVPENAGRHPSVRALHQLLEGRTFDENGELVLGRPPCPAAGRPGERSEEQAACPPPPAPPREEQLPLPMLDVREEEAAPEEDRPMGWLPRLRIFRNPLEQDTFDERRRGILFHRAMELIRPAAVAAAPEDEAGRAADSALRSLPAEVPDRDAVAADLHDAVRWAVSLPDMPQLLASGRPERAILREDGGPRRADFLASTAEGWTVIEYKTGRPAPEHRQQISDYMDLVTGSDGRPARGMLVYLDERRVEHILPGKGNQ